ncbi:bcl-2-like protein 15 isoform X1 [Hemiscyllium ocellatum]|uniref:bcl-2-like protein 15 isoform X1 n=1 Tax=Hemiscyllium ocellatum TaxID=170820 RepID=UPI00296622EB|nr:bcl-2-like protein 15 isoform X1 [Hemiscyllium ocellatum]
MGDLALKTGLIVDRLFEEEEEEDSLDVDSGGSPGTARKSLLGLRSHLPPEDDEILNIARCLRKLGDEYNEIIQSHIKNLKPELNNLEKEQCSVQSVEVFSNMVNQLYSNPEMQRYQQLGFEMNLLRITVALGLGIAKEAPGLLPTIKNAMVNYINSKLLNWVQGRGGWENACAQ